VKSTAPRELAYALALLLHKCLSSEGTGGRHDSAQFADGAPLINSQKVKKTAMHNFQSGYY